MAGKFTKQLDTHKDGNLDAFLGTQWVTLEYPGIKHLGESPILKQNNSSKIYECFFFDQAINLIE